MKKKNPVMLLSSSHSDASVDNEQKKTLIILDYNERKSGVDMFNQNIEEFSCH